MNPKAAAAVIAILFFLPALGNHDLWPPDEPHYAQVSREILHTGDWLLPHVNGRIYPDKPPGYFWAVALAGAPFGDVGPVALRLPSALAAVALALLLAAFGARYLGLERWRVVIVFCTSYMVFELGRSGHLDMPLTLCISASLMAAWRLFQGDGGRTAALLFWLPLAGALLVKGPVGLILPLLVVVVDRTLARRPRDLLLLRPLVGLLVALGPPLLWFLAAGALRPGYDPWTELDRHALSRFSTGLHHVRPFWYFGRQIFMEMFPWAFLLPALLVHGFRALRPVAGPRSSPGDDGARRFLIVWVATILVFFSISTEKRGLYILPMAPAFALLAADLWSALARGTAVAWTRRLAGAGAAVTGLLLTAAIALPWMLPRILPQSADALAAPVLAVTLVAVAGGVSILVLLALRGTASAVSAQAVSILAIFLLYSHVVQPAADVFKSARPFAARMLEIVRPEDRIAMVDWRAAYLYYSGIHMDELVGDEELFEYARGEAGSLLLVNRRTFERVRADLPPARILLEDRVGHRDMLLLRLGTQAGDGDIGAGS